MKLLLTASLYKIIKRKKKTIFLVEQYFDFAFGLSDYLYLIQRGKFIQEGLGINYIKRHLKNN